MMDIFLITLTFIGMTIFAALTTFIILIHTTFVCTPEWLDKYIPSLTKIIIGIWIIILILIGIDKLGYISNLIGMPP